MFLIAQTHRSGVLHHVYDVFCWGSVHGHRHCAGQTVWSKVGAVLQLGAHERRCRAWEVSLPNGSCENPNVQ